MQKKIKARTRRKILPKPKYCFFCQDEVLPDWKNPEVLKRCISERGKILGVDRTGLCQKHQRRLAQAVKRARFLGLLPFVVGVK